MIYKTFFDHRDLTMNVLYKGTWLKMDSNYFPHHREPNDVVEFNYSQIDDCVYPLYCYVEEYQ